MFLYVIIIDTVIEQDRWWQHSVALAPVCAPEFYYHYCIVIVMCNVRSAGRRLDRRDGKVVGNKGCEEEARAIKKNRSADRKSIGRR